MSFTFLPHVLKILRTFDLQDVLSALIVCVYEEPVVPEQAATVTEKLGEYLISVGY